MEDILTVISAVVFIFGVIIVGDWLKKKGYINKKNIDDVKSYITIAELILSQLKVSETIKDKLSLIANIAVKVATLIQVEISDAKLDEKKKSAEAATLLILEKLGVKVDKYELELINNSIDKGFDLYQNVHKK